MKKFEDLFFTVAKILSSARKFEQMHFFYQLLEIDTWNMYGILFSVEQMTFFCWAVEIPKKSVEQLHFEQLTLTQKYDQSKQYTFDTNVWVVMVKYMIWVRGFFNLTKLT